MGLDKLWAVKKRLEQINRDPENELPPEPALPFEQRHRRITLYLENAVYADLQVMRRQGISQSTLVNLAVKEFHERNWAAPE